MSTPNAPAQVAISFRSVRPLRGSTFSFCRRRARPATARALRRGWGQEPEQRRGGAVLTRTRHRDAQGRGHRHLRDTRLALHEVGEELRLALAGAGDDLGGGQRHLLDLRVPHRAGDARQAPERVAVERIDADRVAERFAHVLEELLLGRRIEVDVQHEVGGFAVRRLLLQELDDGGDGALRLREPVAVDRHGEARGFGAPGGLRPLVHQHLEDVGGLAPSAGPRGGAREPLADGKVERPARWSPTSTSSARSYRSSFSS